MSIEYRTEKSIPSERGLVDAYEAWTLDLAVGGEERRGTNQTPSCTPQAVGRLGQYSERHLAASVSVFDH